MKMTIKLNLGNYQSIDFTTNEYSEYREVYEEVLGFLEDWEDYTESAISLANHVGKNINK